MARPVLVVFLVMAGAIVMAASVIFALWHVGLLFHRTQVGTKTAESALQTQMVEQASNMDKMIWGPAKNIKVATAHKLVDLSMNGGLLTLRDERGYVFLLEDDHTLTNLGVRDECVAVSTEGIVASVTALGYVNLGDRQTVVLEGFVAQSVQWDTQTGNLWVSALDANQSGHLFCVDLAGQVVDTLAPIGGSQNQDHFGHTFHTNGSYVIVGHPLDQTAHVYRLQSNKYEAVCVIQPRVSSAHFPHTVAIAPDGEWVILTNPTQTVGNHMEAGTSMVFERAADTYTLKHELYATKPSDYGEFGRTLTAQMDWALLSGANGDHRLYQHGQEVPLVVDGNAKACLLSASDTKVTVAHTEENSICIQSFEPITPS